MGRSVHESEEEKDGGEWGEMGGEETAPQKTTPLPNTRANRAVANPTREEVEKELELLVRDPFRRILADYLEFLPETESLQKFANKSPDKWANAVSILAQLSGYKKDHIEVNNNYLMIGQMDDASLQRALREKEKLYAESQRMITDAPAPPPMRDLAPSRDDSIIDVDAKRVE